MIRKNTWTTYNQKREKEAFSFAEGYKKFLDQGKTERECVDQLVNMAEKEGFVELTSLLEKKKKVKKGDKIYSVWMNKSIVLFHIGEEPMENGMNILGAHIDSPRLDVKQNPLYEEGGFAYLDTHYYGGIKKYQYVAMPLALHGVVVKKDGSTVQLTVGEDEEDPVFFFSDLLIHLAQEQMTKKATEVIEGEMLDLIIGNKPLVIEKEEKEEKEDDKLTKGQRYAFREEKEEKACQSKISGAVKRGILAILKDQYGFEEEDFISAELEIVPAGPARDAGFDRSLILA